MAELDEILITGPDFGTSFYPDLGIQAGILSGAAPYRNFPPAGLGPVQIPKPPKPNSAFVLPPMIAPIVEVTVEASRNPGLLETIAEFTIDLIPWAALGAAIGFGAAAASQPRTERMAYGARRIATDAADSSSGNVIALPLTDTDVARLGPTLADIAAGSTQIGVAVDAQRYTGLGVIALPGGNDAFALLSEQPSPVAPPLLPPRGAPPVASGDAFDWFRWIIGLPEQFEVPDEVMPVPGPFPGPIPEAPFTAPDLLPLLDPMPFAIPGDQPHEISIPRPLPLNIPLRGPEANPLGSPLESPFASPFALPTPFSNPDIYTSPNTNPRTGTKPRPLTGTESPDVPLGLLSLPTGLSPKVDTLSKADKPIGSSICECTGTKKDKKKRKPRNTCHEGRYLQRKNGTIFTPERSVPCR